MVAKPLFRKQLFRNCKIEVNTAFCTLSYNLNSEPVITIEYIILPNSNLYIIFRLQYSWYPNIEIMFTNKLNHFLGKLNGCVWWGIR